MVKQVVFDFDGTLGDTLELILRTNHETRRRMGAPVIPDSTIIATIGIPLWDGIIEMNPGINEADIPAWVKMYREVFDELKHEIVPALFPERQYPGGSGALRGHARPQRRSGARGEIGPQVESSQV